MNFSSLPPAVSQIKGGNLKALAVTGNKRVKSLPDVPTLKEQGIDVVVTSWQGLFAPAKTPDAILDKIEKDTKQAMKEPKWEEALAKDGLELPPDRTRAQFAKFVADEHASSTGHPLSADRFCRRNLPESLFHSRNRGSSSPLLGVHALHTTPNVAPARWRCPASWRRSTAIVMESALRQRMQR